MLARSPWHLGPSSLASLPLVFGSPAPFLPKKRHLSLGDRTPFLGKTGLAHWGKKPSSRPVPRASGLSLCPPRLTSAHCGPVRGFANGRQAKGRNPRLGTAERRRAEQSPTAQAFCRRKRGKTICRVQACSRPDLPLGRGGAREVPRVRSSTGRHRKSCFVCNQW